MTDQSLKAAVERAKAAYDGMSPVDRALHDSDQRRSFVRGQMKGVPDDWEPPRDVLADEVRRLRGLLDEAREALGPFKSISGYQGATGKDVRRAAELWRKLGGT